MTSSRISSHFAELLDCLTDVLAWVKDRQGRYLWVNRAFLIQYSLDHPGGNEFVTVENILGKTDYDLSPAFLADQFRHDDEQVLAGHRIINRIERVGESQDTTVWNITDKVPVVDAKGAITGTAGITRAAGPAGNLEGTAPGFGTALAHMRAHFHHEITNRHLASISNMSVRAFERQFRATFHLTPQKFLRKLRLRIASRALMYTDESLAEIALKCGFADQSHFSREFRRQFGRTPREYREYYKLASDVPVTKAAVPMQ
jgi:transcriptional regulator GlxA family with amidase domain